MPKTPQTHKTTSSVLEEISQTATPEDLSELSLPIKAPTSSKPEAATPDGDFVNYDDPWWDSDESWYYEDRRTGMDGLPAIRPQTRIYRTFDAQGRSTGHNIYANSIPHASAARHQQVDGHGTVYIPAAKLIDIIFQ